MAIAFPYNQRLHYALFFDRIRQLAQRLGGKVFARLEWARDDLVQSNMAHPLGRYNGRAWGWTWDCRRDWSFHRWAAAQQSAQAPTQSWLCHEFRVSNRTANVNLSKPQKVSESSAPLDFWLKPFERVPAVTFKSQNTNALLQLCPVDESELDPHYVAFFECFNRQLFFEAHDVLEELWLGQRGAPNDRFYKGLIQVAGAFVHVRKHRTQPASALLELARANLRPYAPVNDRLDVAGLIRRIDEWLLQVRCSTHEKLLAPGATPRIELLPSRTGN